MLEQQRMPAGVVREQPDRPIAIPDPERVGFVRALLVRPLHLEHHSLLAARRRSDVGDVGSRKGLAQLQVPLPDQVGNRLRQSGQPPSPRGMLRQLSQFFRQAHE
jgi:hypothetical protein